MGSEHFPPDIESIRKQLLDELAAEPTARRFRWRLGRRGLFLSMMGTMFIILGYGYGFTDVPAVTTAQLGLPLMLIPDLRIWGLLWILTGVVAIVNSWWPPGRDALGFVAVEAMAAVWGALNVCGSLFLGIERAYVVGVIFMVQALSILIVSGMVEITPLAKKAREASKNSRASFVDEGDFL